MKIFQIGFNRCATQSLASGFRRCGLWVVHHNWKGNRVNQRRKYVTAEILRNLAAGRKPVEGLPFDVFTDMEDFYEGTWTTAYTEFRAMDAAYPADAKFIMNVRPCADWIVSRTALTDVYAHMTPDVVRGLVEHYFSHCVAVRDYFRGAKRDRLFVMILGIHTVADAVAFGTGGKMITDVSLDFAGGRERHPEVLTEDVLLWIASHIAVHGDPCDLRFWA